MGSHFLSVELRSCFQISGFVCSAVSLPQTARLHSCQMDRNERIRVTNLCCFSSKVSNCIDQEPRPTFFVWLDLKAVLSEDVWPRKQPPRARTADSIRLRCALPKLQLAFLILGINAEEQISSFGNTYFIVGCGELVSKMQCVCVCVYYPSDSSVIVHRMKTRSQSSFLTA